VSLGHLTLGAAAGGLFWGCAEVLWIVAKPLLPFEVLRLQLILPPQNLIAFAGVAIATYLPLALIGGLVAGLPFASRLRQMPAFFLGGFLGLSGLAICAIAIWINMLTPGEAFLSTTAMLLYAATLIGVTTVVGATARVLTRRVSRLGAALAGVVGLGGLLLAVAFTAHRWIEYPVLPPRGIPRAGLPNIVFITIDTLRADHVGAYSNGAVRTPVIDRLAAEGVRFENAISQVPYTTASHVSMFTSAYPFVHGAKNGVPMRADLPTLQLELRRLGYHTAAFVAAYTTQSSITGLGEFFDVYVDSLNPHLAFLSNDETEPLWIYRLLDRLGRNQISAPVVNERVHRWLEASPTEPFFVWIHYFDPHWPYEPLPEYRAMYQPTGSSANERNIALYKAEITYTDDQLGEMLEMFRTRGFLDDAIVVLTSDHGEAFGEPHPRIDIGHGDHLYDSVLRVPLIFWAPARMPSSVVIEDQVQSIDIAPTLLDLIGAPAPAEFAGRSLTPGNQGVAPEVSYGFSQTYRLKGLSRFAVRSLDWKLVVTPDNGEEELFDLRTDPGERENRVTAQPDVARRYRKRLGETIQLDVEGAGPEAIDPETAARLRALGYL
jgi:arylsulfatase A-like enzyme